MRTALSAESRSVRETLVVLGRRYLAAGWVYGTAGNLSARVPGVIGRAVVTASGRHIGDLTHDDFVEVTLDGEVTHAAPGDRPSAEASIHLAIYRSDPAAGCAVHVHTVASTLLQATEVSDVARGPDHVHFSKLEMIKGWGLWAPDAVAALPIFDNHADVQEIATEVAAHYVDQPGALSVPALAITGHGLTAWGVTPFDANRHLEVAEFLCQVAMARA